MKLLGRLGAFNCLCIAGWIFGFYVFIASSLKVRLALFWFQPSALLLIIWNKSDTQAVEFDAVDRWAS